MPGKEKKGAKPGQLVSVEIITYPTRHHPPVGRVIKVLGDANDPEVELRSIIHKFGVRQEFSPKIQKQVQKITGNISDREKKQRRDLTGEMIFTIDGERAKDFDDAVSLETTGNGLPLGSPYRRRQSLRDGKQPARQRSAGTRHQYLLCGRGDSDAAVRIVQRAVQSQAATGTPDPECVDHLRQTGQRSGLRAFRFRDQK